MMFWFLWGMLLVLESGLILWTWRQQPTKSLWLKKRLFLRLLTLCIVIIVMACIAQRWRFMPMSVFLGISVLWALCSFLLCRRQTPRTKKKRFVVIGSLLHLIVCSVFLSPVYLFTDYTGLWASGDYQVAEASAILVDQNRIDPYETNGSRREVPIHVYYPDIQDVSETFPLVVFSHGAFGYYQSNTSTYQALVKRGYIVISLDHPHHAFFTKDTDGQIITVNQTFLHDALTLNDEQDVEKTYSLYLEWMTLREGDMQFVLDTWLSASKTRQYNDNWFYAQKYEEDLKKALAMTDTKEIGLMGHSMGGATSVALGRKRDDISAVIDIDGTMLSEYTGIKDGHLIVNDAAYDVPLLEFVNWTSYNQVQAYVKEGGVYPNDVVMQHAKTGYMTTIRDSLHMDFTDLPMFSPVLGHMLGSGQRDTKEVMTIVNALVCQFYDCYLKGEGDFTVKEMY